MVGFRYIRNITKLLLNAVKNSWDFFKKVIPAVSLIVTMRMYLKLSTDLLTPYPSWSKIGYRINQSWSGK